MEKYARFTYQPCLPLGKDGKRATGSTEHTTLSRRAAGEGMVLLKNNASALPLQKGETVALFGKASIEYIKGGGGSGDVYCAYTHNIYDGFAQKEIEGKVKLYMPCVDYYKDYVKSEGKNVLTREQIEERWSVVNVMDFCQERDDIVYDTFDKMHVTEADAPDELIADAAANADAAVITLSRFSAEGVDRRAVDGDYYLSAVEKSLIDRVSVAFKKTVIVINSGALIDCEYFAENDKVQSVIFGWQGGMEGGMAVADIICGDVNPSGKLGDTIPKSYDAFENGEIFKTGFEHLDYEDDIYVGYRYFETVPGAAEKVRYPFGFGLSYTEFEFRSAFAGESDGKSLPPLRSKISEAFPVRRLFSFITALRRASSASPTRLLRRSQRPSFLHPASRRQLLSASRLNIWRALMTSEKSKNPPLSSKKENINFSSATA